MSHLKIVVDHQKIDYSGPMDLNDFFQVINHFLYERGFDNRQDKDFEQNTSHGKCFEWQIAPWKKITDYIRYIVKVRVLGYDFTRTDAMISGKKKKVDNGRIIIVIDGFMEFDYESYWDDKPFFQFLRTIYDYYIYKPYTERFEQRLVHDINHLYHNIEKFFNIYGNYAVISRKGP